jgi:hypothetical protein
MRPKTELPLRIRECSRGEAFAKDWITDLLSTRPFDESDRQRLGQALKGLYEKRGFKPPPRLLVASSPLSAAVAAGLAAGAWRLGENPEKQAEKFWDSEERKAIDDEFVAVSIRKNYHRTFTYTYDSEILEFNSQTHELMAALLVDNALSSSMDVVAHGVSSISTELHLKNYPLSGEPEARFDERVLADAVGVAAKAIGDGADGLPFAAQWDTLRPIRRVGNLPWIDGMSIKEMRSWYRGATEYVDTFRVVGSERVALFPDRDWADWAAPANLSKGLGRALGWVSHGRLLDMGVKKQIRSTLAKNEKTHWLPRLAFAKIIRGSSVDQEIEEEILATRCAGLRWQHRRFCIVSERPCALRVDKHLRSHCADGPSHQWRDGFALYHWHGAQVPARYIENGSALGPDEWPDKPNFIHEGRSLRTLAMEIHAYHHGREAMMRAYDAEILASSRYRGQSRQLIRVREQKFVKIDVDPEYDSGAPSLYILDAAASKAYGNSPRMALKRFSSVPFGVARVVPEEVYGGTTNRDVDDRKARPRRIPTRRP